MMKMAGDYDDLNPCDEMYGYGYTRNYSFPDLGFCSSSEYSCTWSAICCRKFIFNAFGAKANFGPLDLQSEA